MVGSAAKTELLFSSSTRRGWLIRNNNAIAVNLFFNSSVVVVASFAANILSEPNCQEGFGGRIEAQMVSGGIVLIEVTEY